MGRFVGVGGDRGAGGGGGSGTIVQTSPFTKATGITTDSSNNVTAITLGENSYSSVQYNNVGLITGYTYNWKTGYYSSDSYWSGKEDTGVIAQEVEALGLPGITTTRDNGKKAVRYERLVPLLIQAIKELEARVKTLESS